MKVEAASAASAVGLLVLVMTTGLNIRVVAADPEVVYTSFYTGKDSCEGTPNAFGYLGVIGHCAGNNPGTAIFTSCATSNTYDTMDCTGPHETDTFTTGCQTASDSFLVDCMTVPDNKLGRLQMGSSCMEDGAVSNVFTDKIFVLDFCEPYISGQNLRSYMYTVTNGEFQYAAYLETANCTGEFESYTQTVGSCVQEGPNLARRVTPVVQGTTLSSITLDTQSPTPPTDDEDGDDNNDSGNGSSALDGSVDVFTLVATMVSALALMF